MGFRGLPLGSAAPLVHSPGPRAERGHPPRPGDPPLPSQAPPASLPQDWLLSNGRYLPSHWLRWPVNNRTSVTFPRGSAPSDNHFRVGRARGCRPCEGASCRCWRVAREPAEALQVGRAAAGSSEKRGPRRPASAPAVRPGASLSQGLGTRARLLGAKLRGHARCLPDCAATREPAVVHGHRDR